MVRENYSYCFTCYCGILRRSRQHNKPLAHRIEPDISVVKLNRLDYEDHHPNASEVFLLIEIADSSLKYDREVKAMASPTPRAIALSIRGIKCWSSITSY